jgi:hypothetical protein
MVVLVIIVSAVFFSFIVGTIPKPYQAKRTGEEKARWGKEEEAGGKEDRACKRGKESAAREKEKVG